MTAGCGIVLLSLDRSWFPALIAVILIGVGFSLPYAAVIDRSARVVSHQPATALAHFQTWGNALPMVTAPLIGIALRDHADPLAFGAMGAAVLAAAFASVGLFDASCPGENPTALALPDVTAVEMPSLPASGRHVE